MKIVIYGANELACLIAVKLFEDHDIIIIDEDASNSENFDKLDLEYVVGSGSNISVLESIGIKDADIFIACSGNDEANIVACSRFIFILLISLIMFQKLFVVL